MVRCPVCGSLENRVVDSRSADEGRAIRRRRLCANCDLRFTTFERLEEQTLSVVKRDGRTEAFDPAKVEVGIRSACKGRPVGADAITQLVAEVEEGIRAHGPTVESARVGALALERLRPLDGVAAVRFASVYKGFEGPEDFEEELRLLGIDSPTPLD